MTDKIHGMTAGETEALLLAAILPEGTDAIQRITTRYLDYRERKDEVLKEIGYKEFKSEGRYSVHLLELGEKKLNVIKVIRDFDGASLKAAKKLVETAPTFVLRNVTFEIANALMDGLVSVGASARVIRN